MWAILRDALRHNDWEGRRIQRFRRRPFAFQTSASMDEIDLVMDDGSVHSLLLKDLSPRAQHPLARRAKPSALLDPEREIEVYRHILSPRGIGAPYRGAVRNPALGRYWLLIDRLPGVELWQVGELHRWVDVARWLAAFHSTFAGGGGPEAGEGMKTLIRHDASFYRGWICRAHAFVPPDGESAGGTRTRIRRLAPAYDAVISRLCSLPRTLLHGEFYPSNILVQPMVGGTLVSPVDWEMAALGPGLVDLAALVAGGWSEGDRRTIAHAYRREAEARGEVPWRSPGEFDWLLDGCGLHVALQWLGWSPHWDPPPQHRRDWAAEALRRAEGLGPRGWVPEAGGIGGESPVRPRTGLPTRGRGEKGPGRPWRPGP
jgi:aminoglycoside phosphotransferase (APT) family kinase protein